MNFGFARTHFLGLTSFYFLYFGAIGVYLPYFNLYCKDLGFSGFQLGIVSAVPPFARLVFPVFWGIYADRLGNRNRLMRRAFLAAIASFSLLLWVKQFLGIVLVLILYTFFLVPVLPLWEATVIERLDHLKKDYGQIRLWGSLGFILFSLLVGFLLEFQPSSVILIIFLFLSFLNIGISRISSAGVSPVTGLQHLDLSWIKGTRLWIFLICCALMQASHGTYYAFFTIFMRELNHSSMYIGFLWTVGVAFEVVLMIYAGKLIRRFGHESIFSLTFAATVLRWGLSSVVSGGPLFIFIQGLHGLSFGLFHVCAVTWIVRMVPKTFQTTAQSLFSSATYGVGGIVGFLMNAFLYDRWGAAGLWNLDCAIVLMGLGLSLVFILPRWKK